MDLEQGESSSSKSEVPTLTTTDLKTSQNKETVDKMSVEMFHIHSSMVAATEKVSRMSKTNEKLEIEKQELELQLVELETVKNTSQLVGQHREKNKPCANIAIGLDYDALNSNKKNEDDKGKAIADQDVPIMMRKVDAPLFKACEVNFSEIELVIKQELADEDNKKKSEETTPTTEIKKKPMVNQVSKKPIKVIMNENAGKKKKRSGKIGVNKNNNFVFIADSPRKQYQKCGSTNHLTHLCKKAVSEPKVGACKYNEAKAEDPYSFCDKLDCIPCNMKVMTSCHKLKVDLKEFNLGSTDKKENANQSLNIDLSESSNSTSATSVNKKKYPTLLGKLNTLNHHCVQGKMKRVIWIIDIGCSRYMMGDKALLS
ncbi:hypothetical protein AgCh_026281 [Apium graveolens]